MVDVNMSNADYATSRAYLEDQYSKQYGGAAKTPPPHWKEVQPLHDALAKLTEDRLATLEKLILNKSITHLQAALDMGYFSVYELTLFFLHRTFTLNPLYHAVISVDPKCLDNARAMDRKLSSGLSATGLMGIPIWLKDNIATKGPTPTTGGAAVLAECVSLTDAPIVSALKEAGAILLGKTNLSEWANFMTTQSSNGYSVIGGQTQNPYGPFDVGGSSSGSAVAVALGLSPVAVGTETCGSLVYPASQNGIVTLKPTHGTLSSEGIIPIATSFDTAGPMAMTVQDAYEAYEAMGGMTGQLVRPDFYHSSLANKRIGLVKSPALNGELRPEDEDILTRIRQELESHGAVVTDVHIPEAAFSMPLMVALHEEFEPCLSEYFQYIEHHESLVGILEFNASDLKNRAPYGQDLLEASLNAPSAIASERTREMIEMSRSAVNSCIADYQLNALYHLSNNLALLHAISGYPALTVPSGQRPSGEPIGVTFMSMPESLCTLFEIGHGYEEATGYFKPPVLWK